MLAVTLFNAKMHSRRVISRNSMSWNLEYLQLILLLYELGSKLTENGLKSSTTVKDVAWKSYTFTKLKSSGSMSFAGKSIFENWCSQINFLNNTESETFSLSDRKRCLIFLSQRRFEEGRSIISELWVALVFCGSRNKQSLSPNATRKAQRKDENLKFINTTLCQFLIVKSAILACFRGFVTHMVFSDCRYFKDC